MEPDHLNNFDPPHFSYKPLLISFAHHRKLRMQDGDRKDHEVVSVERYPCNV